MHLARTLRRLALRGNAVVIIEHQTDLLNICDRLVELGPPGARREASCTRRGLLRSSQPTPSRSPDPSSRRRGPSRSPRGRARRSGRLEERRHETRQPADRSARSHADAPHGAGAWAGRPATQGRGGRPLTEEHARYAEARDRLAVFADSRRASTTSTPTASDPSACGTPRPWASVDEILATLEDLTCVPIP